MAWREAGQPKRHGTGRRRSPRRSPTNRSPGLTGDAIPPTMNRSAPMPGRLRGAWRRPHAGRQRRGTAVVGPDVADVRSRCPVRPTIDRCPDHHRRGRRRPGRSRVDAPRVAPAGTRSPRYDLIAAGSRRAAGGRVMPCSSARAWSVLPLSAPDDPREGVCELLAVGVAPAFRRQGLAADSSVATHVAPATLANVTVAEREMWSIRSRETSAPRSRGVLEGAGFESGASSRARFDRCSIQRRSWRAVRSGRRRSREVERGEADAGRAAGEGPPSVGTWPMTNRSWTGR